MKVVLFPERGLHEPELPFISYLIEGAAFKEANRYRFAVFKNKISLSEIISGCIFFIGSKLRQAIDDPSEVGAAVAETILDPARAVFPNMPARRSRLELLLSCLCP